MYSCSYLSLFLLRDGRQDHLVLVEASCLKLEHTIILWTSIKRALHTYKLHSIPLTANFQRTHHHEYHDTIVDQQCKREANRSRENPQGAQVPSVKLPYLASDDGERAVLTLGCEGSLLHRSFTSGSLPER